MARLNRPPADFSILFRSVETCRGDQGWAHRRPGSGQPERWLRLKPIRPPIALYFEGHRIRVLKDVSGREPSAVGCDVLEVNGRSFSATGEFMTAVFANKRGVFIGEESGAGITGNTSGLMIALKLPNSGITISIPMIGYYLAGDHGPHPERGILPDHEVIPTVEDILAGRDPMMEFALELARGPG